MNRIRKAWPMAKHIVELTTAIGVALIFLDWSLYLLGWTNADEFVGGIQDCLAVLVGGVVVSVFWLLATPFFFDGEGR